MAEIEGKTAAPLISGQLPKGGGFAPGGKGENDIALSFSEVRRSLDSGAASAAVMAGLVPAIHVFIAESAKALGALATSASMTKPDAAGIGTSLL